MFGYFGPEHRRKGKDMSSMFQQRRSCPECGAWYLVNTPHACDPKARLDHQVKIHSGNLENDLKKFFGTNWGRFEVYYAERQWKKRGWA